MSRKPSLLIADDERNTREGLRRALSPVYEVFLADNGARALDMVLENSFDLVLTDMRMPELDGISFVQRVATMANPPTCIVMTAYGSIDTAVAAVKAGAAGYITKPINLDDLELVLSRNLEQRSLRTENRRLKQELANQYAFENIIGRSPAMQKMLDTVEQVAPARSTILLTGENGTGKEVVARAIHQLSDRADKPFAAIHCAALAPSLLQSELFGHEKGAFTNAHERRAGRLEAADGGTVFLDEIGEIEQSVQVTLLRVLESRSFERVGGSSPVQLDVRLIAATNRNLRQLVDEGKFREDLYFRLDVINLHMPPLRDRREDVPLLLDFFLKQYMAENQKPIHGFAPDVVDAMVAYHWPGNVRELRNAVERMVVMTRTELISLADVPEQIRVSYNPGATAAVATGTPLTHDENERLLIERALIAHDGNRTRAAKQLGLSRRTIIRKIEKYGITL